MRVLALTERVPSRVGGGAARQLNLIRELSSRHDFTIVTYAYPPDLEHVGPLQGFVRRLEVIELDMPVLKDHRRIYWQLNGWVHTLFDPRPRRGRLPDRGHMRAAVRRILDQERYDVIQVHQAYMARALPPVSVPTVVDMHDVLSDHERRLARTKTKWSHRFAAWCEWKKMEWFERRVASRSDVCVTVSEEDRRSLNRLAPGVSAVVVPNGVDIDYFRPRTTPEDEASLVFVGSMNYRPNCDGVVWFCRAVLPHIKEHVPHVHVYVVGWNPPNEIVALGQDQHITVTGFVDDVRPYLARGTVVLVPIRLGSGTRLKILDAWAMGKAIVSTRLGAEGLQATHKENILLADEPRTFATSVLRLLGDDTLRRRLGEAGRQTVVDEYAWPAVSRRMDAVYQACTRLRTAGS